MFLDHNTTSKQISQLIKKGDNTKMAVAYWGDGSIEKLGIDCTSKRLDILCSLRAGATNPSVIRKLRSLNHVRVRHLDGLHSKCYISDNQMIIGSSNASSNGLNLSDSEINPGTETMWWEANYLVTDTSHITHARKWFDRLWEIGKEVTSRDLQVATEQWASRRANRKGLTKSRKVPWSLNRLKSKSQTLSDRNIFVEHHVYGDSKEADDIAQNDLTSRGIPKDSISEYGWTWERGKVLSSRYIENTYYIILTTKESHDDTHGKIDIDIVRYITSPYLKHRDMNVWMYEYCESIPIPGENDFKLSDTIQEAIIKHGKTIIKRIDGGRIELSEMIELI